MKVIDTQNGKLKLGRYLHKKGNIYDVLGVTLNATNAQNGQILVRYVDPAFPKNEYSRDWEEFFSPEEWPDGEVRSRFCPVEDVKVKPA